MKTRAFFFKSDEDYSKLRFPFRPYSNQFLRIRVGRADQNRPRFGFIVPKKVVGKVVERNLIKRRLKAILLKNVEHFKTVDVLIFPNKEAGKIKFCELEEQTLALFKKAGIWKKE
ncbi:MAG: ribonuclease P protein component [Candidatus Doudnabacteria bacterium]|nr:ribonuclease P protein component [Candidatus Doudnabacteria bacterium]